MSVCQFAAVFLFAAEQELGMEISGIKRPQESVIEA
jgi:hypothetical protein